MGETRTLLRTIAEDCELDQPQSKSTIVQIPDTTLVRGGRREDPPRL